MAKQAKADSLSFSDKEKRQILLDIPSEKSAASWKAPLQNCWDGGSRTGTGPRYSTEQERYDAVIGKLKDLKLLLPDREDKCREIFALIEWPTKSTRGANIDFSPIPTFEVLFGGTCRTCGGTGVSGFISGIRCPDC